MKQDFSKTYNRYYSRFLSTQDKHQCAKESGTSLSTFYGLINGKDITPHKAERLMVAIQRIAKARMLERCKEVAEVDPQILMQALNEKQ